MRPTRAEALMAMAETVATRGTCDRKQVGAVIAREGRIISVGYNGAPPGLLHCDENQHGWKGHPDVVKLALHGGLTEAAGRRVEGMIAREGCRNATHAEANALAFAAKYGVATDLATLFVTVSPCDTCARLLIAAGIARVEYKEEYRDRSGIDLLISAGLEVTHTRG